MYSDKAASSAPAGTERLDICEPFFFLQAAVARVTAAGLPLSTAGLLQSVDALGTRFASPVGWYGTSFGGGRRHGAAAARYFTYLDECSCYRSSGPVVAIP